ncbi:hypothetical protein BMS3Bbin10_02316 [bacterium BMS3Bbin10]|nr:hypothetical protein BMS3Bbin10_02316 [bacterium BMS3Bbin10]
MSLQEELDRQRNVFGEFIEMCSNRPMTGFYRSGCCHTGEDDVGLHTVCVEMTAEFLSFSKIRGNDLSTPLPEFGFPGLNPGDRWCLCAERWKEALQADMAPRVVLRATHEATLEVVSIEDLKRYAIDLV